MKRSLLFPIAWGGLAFASCFVARRYFSNHVSVALWTSMNPPSGVTGNRDHDKSGYSAAWASALQEKDAVLRMENLQSLLRAMEAGELRLLAGQSIDDADVLAMVIQQWALKAPRDALEWCLLAMKSGSVPWTVQSQVVSIWAKQDSAAVIAWLKDPAHKGLQRACIKPLVAAVFARDPAAALALAEVFPDGWTLPPEAAEWIKEHPEMAGRAIVKLPESNREARQLWERVSSAWAENDPAGALAFSAELEPRWRGNLIKQSLEAWAKQDPAAAAAYYEKLPRGEADAEGLAKSWALKDPNAALQWALLRHPHDRGKLVTEIIRCAGETDIPQACNLLPQIADGPLRDSAAAGLMQTWAKLNPKAALSWAFQQSAGPTRNGAIVEAVRIWRDQDLTATAEFALTAPAGSLPPSAYANIMYSLRNDPTAAYTWLNQLPDHVAEHSAKAFVQFARHEPEVNAILALPDGKYKAQLVKDSTRNFFQANPDQALMWALGLPDPNLRQTLRQAVESVEATDSPSFFNAITEVKKADLLERLK